MTRPDDQTLIVGFRSVGFFSNFNAVLNNLHHRLGRDGIAAVKVDWKAGPGKCPTSYGRTEDGNLWLELFEALPFREFPEKTIATAQYASLAMTGNQAYAMYKLDQCWRQTYNQLYRRYIRIRPQIADRVAAIHAQYMSGHYCVGVHYRDPQHDGECLYPMPKPAEFIARLRRRLPKNRSWRVFLATDFFPAAEAFRGEFGCRLIMQPNVQRLQNQQQVNLYNYGATTSVKLAEEVLVDCLLLSRCDALLHVTSNVATAAGYMNPSLRMVYCETVFQSLAGLLWSWAVGPRQLRSRIASRIKSAAMSIDRKLSRAGS